MSLEMRMVDRDEIVALAEIMLQQRYKVFESYPTVESYGRLDTAMLVFQQARAIRTPVPGLGIPMSFTEFISHCETLSGEVALALEGEKC